ncbi:MAG: hypothetical protein RQ757_02465 [Pseudomonadales bacterium]|nr:hypothetical protein [Pseudomonadales bacterium]
MLIHWLDGFPRAWAGGDTVQSKIRPVVPKRKCKQLMMGMFCIGLAACAARISLPPARELLEPEINSENTKFFIFRRENNQQLLEESPTPASIQTQGRTAAGAGRDEAMARLVLERVTLVLEKTGYCREGFFELFRENSRNGLMLRGECREAASPQDRQHFGEIIDVSSVTRSTPPARF